MKLCPFCAEEIQDAAIRCKHCRSDLPGTPAFQLTRAPRGRRLRAALAALIALAVAAPVVARPVLERWRSGRCEPSNWVEWHVAMRKQCLQASYVCEHMTTSRMMEDPDIARSFQGGPGSGDPAHLAEMVGRMRSAFGCAPESGPAFHAEPPVVAPSFPITQDAPRSL